MDLGTVFLTVFLLLQGQEEQLALRLRQRQRRRHWQRQRHLQRFFSQLKHFPEIQR